MLLEKPASMEPDWEMRGWQSWHRTTSDGAVESGQRVNLAVAVVGFSEDGARALGEAYWAEVERSTLRIVRRRRDATGMRLCLMGCWPTLLRLGEPELEIAPERIVCRYRITGGVLARRPQGEISFTQAEDDGLELRSTIRDFFPTLAARKGRPNWTGALYEHLQGRIHVAISRRYFGRLIERAQR